MKNEIQLIKVKNIGLLLHIEAKIKNQQERFYIWKDDLKAIKGNKKKIMNEVKKLMPEIFI